MPPSPSNFFSSGLARLRCRLARLSPEDRELAGACTGIGVVFVAITMAGPLVPLMLVSLKAAPTLLGLVAGVSTLGSLFVGVPTGMIVQKYGTRTPMVLASLGLALSCVFLITFPTILGLFIGLSLMEVAKIVIIVGVQAHVGNLGDHRDASLDFGWYGTAAALGQLVGPALGGWLIDLAGYGAAWLGVAVIMGLAAVIFRRLISPGLHAPVGPVPPAMRGEEIPEIAGTEAGSGLRRGWTRLFNRYAVIAIIASFTVLFGLGSRITFFPVYLKELGYSATAIGLLLSLQALASMSVRLFLPRFISLFRGKMPCLVFAVFVVALGLGLTPLCTNLPLLVLDSCLIGLGIGVALPLSMATVSEGVAREDRGLAIGIRLTGNRLAQLINPVFFGIIAELAGLGTSFYAGGLFVMIVGLPLVVWWLRDRRQAA